MLDRSIVFTASLVLLSSLRLPGPILIRHGLMNLIMSTGTMHVPLIFKIVAYMMSSKMG